MSTISRFPIKMVDTVKSRSPFTLHCCNLTWVLSSISRITILKDYYSTQAPFPFQTALLQHYLSTKFLFLVRPLKRLLQYSSPVPPFTLHYCSATQVTKFSFLVRPLKHYYQYSSPIHCFVLHYCNVTRVTKFRFLVLPLF